MRKFVVFALFAALAVSGLLLADAKDSSDNDLSANGSVVIKKDTLVYKGKALKPAVKVYCGGNKPLKKKKDYSLTYENNDQIGTARAVATGAGKYTGQAVGEFTINPGPVKIKKLKSIESGFEASWKPSAGVDGYELLYTAPDESQSGSLLVAGEQSSSVQVTRLVPNTTYQVCLRSYKKVDGKNYYSAWSKAKKFTVAKSKDPDDGGDDDIDDGPAFAEKYMVVDLASGAISYLDDKPKKGWSDTYKTTKMVLRKISAGKFMMGSPTNEFGREEEEVQHEVTLTKDFYIGVFEMTQKQYAIVTGDDPSYYKGDLRPVEQLSYDAIRGRNKGATWPASSEVDEDSFFGKFRAKTGKAFDLPTEAQWEYACRAGTTTALNNGTNITNEFDDGNMFKLGRVYHNMKDGKGGYEYTTVVGCYLPNAWGLYDMHGNALEYCLDWYSENMAADPVTDPKGPETGFYRVLRGGSYYFYPKESRSAYRSRYSRTDNYNNDSGIRVVLVLE